MNIRDAENLSAADLKEKQTEIAEVLSESDPKELATRYVAARLDAKLRDEKLGQQGTTIDNLNHTIDQERKAQAELSESLQQAKAELEKATQQVKVEAEKTSRLSEQLTAQTSLSAKLKTIALSNATAMSTAAKALNDAIAAARIDAVEN